MNRPLSNAEIRTYLEECVAIAHKSPQSIKRPLVGALIIDKKKQRLSEGYKQFIYDNLIIHAERVAINAADPDLLTESTLITTLEPCPPDVFSHTLSFCSKYIVDMGIRSVIVGYLEWNRLQGKGVAYLREHNVDVRIFSACLDDPLMKSLDEIYFNHAASSNQAASASSATR